MPIYHCDLCNFSTPLKSNYTSHLSTKKHISISNLKTINPMTTQKQQSDNPKTITHEQTNDFTCKYCEQTFTFRQSMNRHIKYTCTKNKDEDLRKQVYLLKKQLEDHTQIFTKIIQDQNMQMDELSEKLEKLTYNLEINDSFNTTNHIQNIYMTYHANDLIDKDCAEKIKV